MKYQLHDWLTSYERVFLRIIAAIPGEEPLYAVHAYKPKTHISMEDNDHLRLGWLSEFELDDLGLQKHPTGPDYEAWSKVQAGDLIKIGDVYAKVLTRIDDLVMVSASPPSQEQRKEGKRIDDLQDKLSGELKELTGGASDDFLETTFGEIKKSVLPHSASGEMLDNKSLLRMTHGHWHTIQELAEMNWELLRE